jgi:hypothetical protein
MRSLCRIAIVNPAPPAFRSTGVVRLVVVLAALVGLALIQSPHCSAGTAMGMPAAATATASCAACGVSQADIPPAVHQHGPADGMLQAATVVGDMGTDHHVPAGPAGITMACLAVFLALLAGFAALRPDGRADRTRLPLLLTSPRPRQALPRPPSLAELCVLRT